MKQVFRTKLSFSKQELEHAFLGIDYAGISLPRNSVQFDKKKQMSFGFFGSDSDSNKFYPGVSSQIDVVPKEEDFVEAPFRLLSAAIVGAGSWKCTDFSDITLLKKSFKRLSGKPIYKDHNTDIDSWIGYVKNVEWQDAFKNGDGTPVPAGINGLLAIDGKTEPKMARGVLMGTVFSNSVTVEFDWMPSHQIGDKSNPYAFLERVGTMHEDGTMIRRVVTAIFDYHETSMTWLGADPFAKLIDKDGNLRNIDISSIQYSKETDEAKNQYNSGKYKISFGLDAKTYLSLSRQPVTNDNHHEKSTTMKKFLAAFIAIFGTQLGLTKEATETDLEKDEVIDKLKNFKLIDEETTKKVNWFQKFYDKAIAFLKISAPDTANVDVEQFLAKNSFIATAELARLVTLDAQIVTLNNEKAQLQAQVASLTPRAAVGDGFTKMKRDETVRLYKLAVGAANADQAVVSLIQTAAPDALEGLLKQYTKGATVKFAGRCKSCGSEEFEFRSTLASAEEEAPSSGDEVSFGHLLSKFGNNSMQVGKRKAPADAK